MPRRFPFAILVAMLGCGDDAALPPPGPAELADDERLGVRVMEGSAGRELDFAIYYVGDRVYVAVHQGAGIDDALGVMAGEELRFFEVGDVSMTVTEHPPPPLAPEAGFLPSVDTDGNALLLGTVADGGGELAFFDGAAWESRPAAPVPNDAIDELASRTSGRLLARAGLDAYLFDGTSWIEVAVPDEATDLRLGPWDADGFRLVWVTDDQLQTQRYSGSTAELRGEVASFQGDFGGLVGSAIDGDTTSFQVVAGRPEVGGFSFLFEDESFALAAGAPAGTYFPAPRSDERLFAVDGDPERGLRYATAGELGDVALHPFRPHLSCGCTRPDDPTCDCVDRAPSGVVYAGAPSADRLAIAMVDDVEGRRSLHLRIVDLPTVASPFLDRTPACGPTCDVDAGVVECVVDTLGASRCVPVGTVPDGGLLDAGPTPFDAGDAYGATIVGSFVRSEEAGAPVIVEVVPVTSGAVSEVIYADGFEIACTPGATYRITIRSADDHRPITFDATAPATGEVLDVGSFTMIIGELLGPAFGDEAIAPTAVVSPLDSTMVVVGRDGWHVLAADDTSRTGFVSSEVAGTPGLLPTSVSAMRVAPALIVANDGVAFLAETTTGLAAIDAADPSLIGELTGDFDLERIWFADGIPLAMIPRSSTGPVVAGWDGGSFRAILEIEVAGQDDWLAPDGSELLRVEGAEVVAYEVATGTRTVVRAMGSGRWMRLGNGDVAGVQGAGMMPGLGTCWSDADGCDATIVRADGLDTQTLSAIHGFAASTINGFLFYTRRASGVVVPERFSLAGGSVPIAGLTFSDVGFEWLQHGDAVTFQDDVGYRSVEISTGDLIHTEMGAFDARARSDGKVVLVPTPCGVDCDMIVLDPSDGSVTRIADGGGAVFLGPALTVEVGATDDEVTVGARTFAREATPATELASPSPSPVAHQGAPCWPYSWLELGPGGAPVTRSLYCAR